MTDEKWSALVESMITQMGSMGEKLQDGAVRTDAVNKRLTIIVVVAFICIVAIVGMKDGFYFFADYGYANQEINQTQNIKGVITDGEKTTKTTEAPKTTKEEVTSSERK